MLVSAPVLLQLHLVDHQALQQTTKPGDINNKNNFILFCLTKYQDFISLS